MGERDRGLDDLVGLVERGHQAGLQGVVAAHCGSCGEHLVEGRVERGREIPPLVVERLRADRAKQPRDHPVRLGNAVLLRRMGKNTQPSIDSPVPQAAPARNSPRTDHHGPIAPSGPVPSTANISSCIPVTEPMLPAALITADTSHGGTAGLCVRTAGLDRGSGTSPPRSRCTSCRIW
ncbi:hypothetical protein ACFPIJ_00130 [Dactylosporangium cerinum]|uniref:Uncharacterized protein n=1 Tax=Dactylosporangium cerinum TaxID=1434730 RepID=A0ABV9VIK9_9ACTN